MFCSNSSQDDSSDSHSAHHRDTSSSKRQAVSSSRSGDKRQMLSSQKQHKALSAKHDRLLVQKAAMRSRGLKSAAAANSLVKARDRVSGIWQFFCFVIFSYCPFFLCYI